MLNSRLLVCRQSRMPSVEPDDIKGDGERERETNNNILKTSWPFLNCYIAG